MSVPYIGAESMTPTAVWIVSLILLTSQGLAGKNHIDPQLQASEASLYLDGSRRPISPYSRMDKIV